MGSLDQTVRLRVASFVGKEEEQRLSQASFLLPPMNGSSLHSLQGSSTSDMVQAFHSMASSPSTLQQHVNAYSHVSVFPSSQLVCQPFLHFIATDAWLRVPCALL